MHFLFNLKRNPAAIILQQIILQDGSAKVVVLLVLLVWWLDIPKHHDAPYQVIEYFAGVGRIAALAKLCGFTTAAVDIDYSREWGKRMGRRPPMDLNGNAATSLIGTPCFSIKTTANSLWGNSSGWHQNKFK